MSINFDPAKSYITMEAVTDGEIPNSIRVPLFEANMTLILNIYLLLVFFRYRNYLYYQ